MKKIFLFCQFLFSSIIFAQMSSAQLSVQGRIDSLITQPFFDTATVSVSVYNLTKGKEVYNYKNTRLMRPASNMKVLTTAAALYFLGPEYDFKTSFYYSGTLKDTVLDGDIYVVGGCDPDFSIDDLDTVVLKIASMGIKQVTGNIYGDVSFMDSLFWGKGWMWDDDPSTDAPYMSALNINSNSASVFITPSSLGQPPIVKTYPSTSFFTIRNNAVTVLDTPYTFQWDRKWLERSNELVFQGRMASGRGGESSDINVYDPAKYFLTLFKEKLNNYGISIKGNILIKEFSLSDAVFMAEKRRKFSEVIVNLNKTSDNLSAEMTLRVLAEKYYGSPARAQDGIKMIDSLITLSELDKKNYRIVDGSGVSHYNHVSSQLFMNVLRYMYYADPKGFSILYDSFPVAGVDGTLRNRMKGTKAFNNVHAKTGTLSGVSTLSGYVTNSSGELLAFSIMVQGYTGASRKATEWQDRICTILAE